MQAPNQNIERRLLSIEGVSPGDACQVVSCAFPTDGDNVGFHPRLDWFVAEDADLVDALRVQKKAGNLPELDHFSIGTSEEIVEAHALEF